MFPQKKPEEFGHVEKTIQVGKSTKAEAIELLGVPQWEDPRDGSLYYSGKVVGQTFCAIVLVGTFGWPVPLPFPFCETEEPEDWWIRIALDENEVVASVETKMEDEAEAAIREIEVEKLHLKADAGDRAAAFALASDFDDITYLKKLAQEGDAEAIKQLFRRTGEVTGTLRELAESGDLAAAILLARGANDLGPLRSLAESGDYEAAHFFAARYDNYSYLEKLGKEGDYVVAYELYQQYIGEKEPSQFIAAWRWLCLSANAGYSKAQAQVGYWHRSTSWDNWRGWNEEALDLLRKVGAQPDNRIAHMWYTLAVSTGDASTLRARDYYFAGQLTDAEIVQAKQIARDWRPGDCPSAEHRLAPPGET